MRYLHESALITTCYTEVQFYFEWPDNQNQTNVTIALFAEQMHRPCAC